MWELKTSFFAFIYKRFTQNVVYISEACSFVLINSTKNYMCNVYGKILRHAVQNESHQS